MNLITLDFETYYDREFSLSKMTTEEYVRDRRFEIIGLGVKINAGETTWLAGESKVSEFLTTYDFSDTAILCHNTAFDGAILSWRYNVKPKAWFDTMCMARALHGTESSVALKALAERYKVGVKGTEVLNALGKRFTDFTPVELATYGDYCKNDVELTYDIFYLMAETFPPQELRVIDATLRMFIDPVLELDTPMLEQHLENIRDRKDALLVESGVTDKKDLMSNPKFALMLNMLGVTPPTKTSPTTGKATFAFAKNDEAFKALLEHEDDRVQSLVSARLGLKSTLEETRTQRFIDISKRGKLPVPIRYYAAHTGRWGGDDKINLQNLPSRGPNAKQLKRAIIAPEGYTIIESDSSQIEARVLAWLAEQNDLVHAFAIGDDVYKQMASAIYDVAKDQVSKDQRFVGKTTILGAGYGMGPDKFQAQLKTFGVEMSIAECRRVISVYRDTYWKITQLWRAAHNTITYMENGDELQFGKAGVLKVDVAQRAIILPSGLPMFYHGLKGVETADGTEYTYQTRKGPNRIYGGKVVENVCQAIARCIIGEQMLQIAKKYRVVLTVHDSLACCVPDAEAEEAKVFVEQCMRWVPEWATGLPVNCEAGSGKNYGDTE